MDDRLEQLPYPLIGEFTQIEVINRDAESERIRNCASVSNEGRSSDASRRRHIQVRLGVSRQLGQPVKVFPRQPIEINEVDRVVYGVTIEVRIPARKPDRVFRRPPPRFGIVVAGAEADELGVAVIEPPGEAEGLKAGLGV